MPLALCVLLAVVAVGLGTSGSDPAPPYSEPRRADGVLAVPGAGFLGGDFSLTDLRGRQVSSALYGEKLLLLTFGATASDLGSLTLDLMSRALSCLGPDAARLQALFISLDTDHDHAGRLGEYLASFDPRIAGLRGTRAEIQRLARSYRVQHAVVETTRGRRFVHSAFLYLAGPGGRLERYYPPSVPANVLCADARDLLRG